FEDHEAPAGRRHVRGVCRCERDLGRDVGGDPGIHDPYDRGSDRRRGHHATPVGGSLGSRRACCLGVGPHDPRRLRHGVARLPAVQGAGAMRLSRRTWFFLAMSAACLLLLAPTPEKYRWVNLSMAALSLMWFVLLAAEEILARRGENRPRAGRSHRLEARAQSAGTGWSSCFRSVGTTSGKE